jgi:hypothetical protein
MIYIINHTTMTQGDYLSSGGFIDQSVHGAIIYLPYDPESLTEKISQTRLKFACFIYEDQDSTRAKINRYIAGYMQENPSAYIENVPLPDNPADSFEWLYSKLNWVVDYFLEKVKNSNTSNMLFIVGGSEVPVIVALYTVSLQRNTRFTYFNTRTRTLEKQGSTDPNILPSLFKAKGEPYRTSAFTKFKEGYYGAAYHDFLEAWNQAGDKAMYALALLSSCYEYLDRLAYAKALEQLKELLKDENCVMRLTDLCGSGVRNQLVRLNEFLEIARSHFGVEGGEEIKVLADLKAVEIFVRSLYSSAMRRIKVHEFEQAVLLLYRIVEVVAQHLLAAESINPSEFDLSKIESSKREALVRGLSKFYHEDEEKIAATLSRGRIGALDSWAVYLLCFGKGELGEAAESETNIRFLGKIREMIELRNRCYLEHGINGVTKDQADRFAEWTKHAIVRTFLGIEVKKAEDDPDLKPVEVSSIV